MEAPARRRAGYDVTRGEGDERAQAHADRPKGSRARRETWPRGKGVSGFRAVCARELRDERKRSRPMERFFALCIIDFFSLTVYYTRAVRSMALSLSLLVRTVCTLDRCSPCTIPI